MSRPIIAQDGLSHYSDTEWEEANGKLYELINSLPNTELAFNLLANALVNLAHQHHLPNDMLATNFQRVIAHIYRLS